VEDYLQKGIRYVICTDISKDGMLEGPASKLYDSMIRALPEIKLVASGGISKMEELPVLQQMGCDGTIIGKAIYEDKISLKELEQFILNNS
jgi:phosphoribosylformimino-5-aminoimidazole carboxamide ribotide isomerase